MSTKIGFIGQGWIGKHYADDFENRLYEVVRYALEEPYVQNKNEVTECDIVFIAVPTPTTKAGFDCTAVVSSLELLKPGAIAVIKSTMLPGETERLQEQFSDLFVFHSPEFLVEATAAYDAAKPNRNIIGTPKDSKDFIDRAETVMHVLPEAPFNKIMSAREAELVKYAGNCFLYTKVAFMNILYDLTSATGSDWENVREAMTADPRIGESHTQPVHVSGHDTDREKVVRGAGGHCFIKDYEAMRLYFAEQVDDQLGLQALEAYQKYNNALLRKSGKDLDLLRDVHGE